MVVRTTLGGRIARALVPPAIRADPDANRRAQLLLLIVAVLTTLSVVRIVTFAIAGSVAHAAILSLLVIAMAAAPLLLRVTGSLVVASNLVMLTLFVAAARLAFYRGGLGSAPLVGAGALPLIATFLGGRRTGIAWTFVVLVEVALFAFFRRTGQPMLDHWRPGSFWIETTGALLFPIVVLAAALAYEWTKDAALEAKMSAERQRTIAERESNMLRADRMSSLGQLAAGIAHEANNPLAYVSANLAFAQDRLAGMTPENMTEVRAEIEEALAETRQGAERIQRVVRDLKTFARPDGSAPRAPVQIANVVDATLKMANNELLHRARVSRHYDDVPAVIGDEARLAQVFLNLLLNAAQSIPEGRADQNEIDVTIRRDDELVAVEIRDTGCGIAPENLHRVTEPFFTTKPVGIGTGLGLSVCKGIVDSFKGKLTIESGVGRGTLVRVALPIADEAAATAEPPRASPERRDAEAMRAQASSGVRRKLRILVVDDDPLLQKAMRRMLREHLVTVAGTGREAIELVRRGEPFDLILCDVMMPELTGVDVFDHIAAIDRRVAERIVFVTGGAFAEATAKRLERLPNRRFTKPIDRAKLNEILRAAASPAEGNVG